MEKGELNGKNLTGNKRKNSIKMNCNSKRIRNKIQRSGNRRFPYENNFDDNLENNNLDCERDLGENEYCIPACLLGRKYHQETNDFMIGCDNCNNWYHPKCIKISDEDLETLKASYWSCSDCRNNN